LEEQKSPPNHLHRFFFYLAWNHKGHPNKIISSRPIFSLTIHQLQSAHSLPHCHRSWQARTSPPSFPSSLLRSWLIRKPKPVSFRSSLNHPLTPALSSSESQNQNPSPSFQIFLRYNLDKKLKFWTPLNLQICCGKAWKEDLIRQRLSNWL